MAHTSAVRIGAGRLKTGLVLFFAGLLTSLAATAIQVKVVASAQMPDQRSALKVPITIKETLGDSRSGVLACRAIGLADFAIGLPTT